ncbi:hypothetical protein ACFVP0_25615 [Streptomyces cinereoruber]|uniref:hypothetical protein n=1 Tax=Streptomyces cinereoruber TaxID=67260 RepID=UPI003677B248
MERGIDIDNEAGVVVVGDGNTVGFGTGAGAAVRSAYREQVRRIAPPELVGREEELAELAEFCRTGTGYRWWRADAWAGKTALMAWFALAPPEGVRIVPFFVTARLGAQNDVAAYVDVVLEQLVELAGEGLPALLTAATREAHLLRLYASAAEACAARGERLVLLVDGLDEDRGVTTGPDARSIAALLPYGALDLPVVVSGRLHPPLPADAPEDHPLRDPSIVRLLSSSPKARAIRSEAERELKHFVEGGGLPYELLGLVTAAGGGLTADDLAELTGEIPYRVRDVLRTGPGRTFALRGEAYLLAHEELAVQAREMLGARELGRWRAALCDWAEEWRARGWPTGSPAYLLHGWFPMLRAVGDLERMLTCALDEGRHARLLEETGGIGEALGETRATGEAVLGRNGRPELVTTMLRLGFHREELTRRAGDIPAELAASWAAAGQAGRAAALVRSENRVGTAYGLCAVARRLMEAGDRRTAEELVAEAEEIFLAEGDLFAREMMAEGLLPALLVTGRLDRAEACVGVIEHTARKHRLLVPLLDALCAAGEYERAAALVGDPNDVVLVPTVERVARALTAAGRAAEAEQLVRDLAGRHPAIGVALLVGGARALGEAGHKARAEGLRSAATKILDRNPHSLWLHETGRALAAAGEFESLDRWSDRLYEDRPPGLWGIEFADAGAWDRARQAAAEVPGTTGGTILRRLADRLLEAGCLDETEEVLDREGLPSRDQAWLDLARARLHVGDLDGVDAALGRLSDAWHEDLLVEYARALCRAGQRERAEELADEGRSAALVAVGIADALLDTGDRAGATELLVAAERRLRTTNSAVTAEFLVKVAGALVGVGRTEEARALLATAERHGAADGGPGFASVLVAMGETNRAEELAESKEGNRRDLWTEVVIRARLAEGDFDAVVRLARNHGQGLGQALRTAVRGLARAGQWERAKGLVEPKTSYGQELLSLVLTQEMARNGRKHEAAHRLVLTGNVPGGGLDTDALPDRVRALLALGRRAEAERLVERERADGATTFMDAQYVVEALVVLGAHEKAVDHARGSAPRHEGRLLLSVAWNLVREGAYEQAVALLAGLHSFGSGCAAVYANLAVLHPDPDRSEEFTALALHLGPWDGALPAVLHRAPDALPLVLAEADRLRRALEV